jgi:hypothetical protein
MGVTRGATSQNVIEFLENIFNELEYFVEMRMNNGGNYD